MLIRVYDIIRQIYFEKRDPVSRADRSGVSWQREEGHVMVRSGE